MSGLGIRPAVPLGQADFSRPETYVKLGLGGLFVAVGLYNTFRSRGPISMVVDDKKEEFLLVPHSDFVDTLASVAAVGGGAFIIADAFGVELLGGRGQ